MNKFKTISLSMLALAGITLAGCEDTLFENVNPDQAHTNTAEQAMPVEVFYASQVVYDHAEYYIYLSQCLTTMGKSQTGSYSYKSGWEFLSMNRHPQWRRHFYDIGVNGRDIIENSRELNSPNYELIVRTIQLMSSQLTTDAFGDMPRSEAYESIAPTYDSQASIYAWMFKEADELLALYDDPSYVNSPTNQAITSKMDRVYGGDLSKWKGLVYAVKARLLLRNIPNVDRSAATLNKIIDTAQKAIDTWRSGDLMYGTWFGNEPRYNYDGGTTEQNAPWSIANPIINSWESRNNLLNSAVPSKFFVEDCLGVVAPGEETNQGAYGGAGTQGSNNGYGNDPRINLLFKPQKGPVSASNSNEKVMVRYLENNIGAGTTYKQVHFPDLYMGAYAGGIDAYNPIFTMEELYFIQAEAYYWLGQKDKACELAKEATKWNIQRHYERFLKDQTAEDAAKTTSYPGNWASTGRTKSQWEAYLNSFLENETVDNDGKNVGRTKPCSEIGNKHYFFNPSEFTLSDLMIQKYIAMYMQPEQWTDMRRYHYSNNRNAYAIGDAQEIVYPKLRRPYNLYAPYWVDGLSETEKENTWIQRLNYDPETEEKYNRAELERLGAYKNFKWLREPMIWSQDYGKRTSLTAE